MQRIADLRPESTQFSVPLGSARPRHSSSTTIDTAFYIGDDGRFLTPR